MPDALDPGLLLRHLSKHGVEHIVIGGFAVVAHGNMRTSKDLDIVPETSHANLERLAAALLDINSADANVSDFDQSELPMSATHIDDLEQGGNFRLITDLGALDVMQWVSGIDVDDLYRELDGQAMQANMDGIMVRVCSLEHLRAMKQAAGRPQDLEDLNRLGAPRTLG